MYIDLTMSTFFGPQRGSAAFDFSDNSTVSGLIVVYKNSSRRPSQPSAVSLAPMREAQIKLCSSTKNNCHPSVMPLSVSAMLQI